MNGPVHPASDAPVGCDQQGELTPQASGACLIGRHPILLLTARWDPAKDGGTAFSRDWAGLAQQISGNWPRPSGALKEDESMNLEITDPMLPDVATTKNN
jgi:hypothetical protein